MINPQSKPLSLSEVEDRLFRHSELHAARLGYRFGDGAEGDVRNRARDAARRLVDPAPPTVSDDRPPPHSGSTVSNEIAVRQAEVALEVLVEQMIFAARSISGYEKSHPGVIGEETFRKALAAICPAWPLC